MKIAVFNSRKEKLCENKEISWEAFCHKVSQTKRTSETMVEYDSFPKEKQEIIKKLNLLDKKERNEIIERINNFLDKNEGKIQTSMVGIPKDQQ